ncbi:MAG TPA: DUF4232 domain-containing protein [Jatrophihabitans sp.]|nr:DUF4232 domain-containing protein [Jatrophihabitans sp.]
MKAIRLVLASATALAGVAIGLLPGADAAATVPACGNTSLDYGLSRTEGFMGHSAFVLEFRNHTHATCSLYGYPGLDAMASNGTVLAHARRTLTGSAGGSRRGLQVINVPPGGFASATVEWANFDQVTTRACRYSAGLKETAPNTTRIVPQRRGVGICSLQIHPTVLGWTGQS